MAFLRTLLVVIAFQSNAHAGLVGDCLRYLGLVQPPPPVQTQTKPATPWVVTPSGVLFKGLALTGKDEFSEPVVLNNLDFIPTQNAPWTDENFKVFKGRKILSLGEGTSSVVMMLRKNGFNARALDVWYGRNDYPRGLGTETLHWFLAQYEKTPEALINGDARKIPLPDESEDLVFSHHLVNNLVMADKKRVLMEAIRINTVGGESRHYGFSAAQLDQVIPFLKSTYGDAIEIGTVQKQSEIFIPHLGRRQMDSSVLIVRKKTKTDNPTPSFPADEEKPEPPAAIPNPVPIPARPQYQGGGVRGLN